MRLPVTAGWILLGVFTLLAVPNVFRLVRAAPGGTNSTERPHCAGAGDSRENDLAELLMVVAMAAMVSPLGGPIPAAGWAAVLLLAAGWFLVGAVRGRRFAIHHTIVAAVMLYMIIAMPAHHTDHGPWFTMSVASTPPAQSADHLLLPALAVLAAGYFCYDVVRAGRWLIRDARPASVRDLLFSRPICRVVMGAGMAYLLISAIR